MSLHHSSVLTLMLIFTIASSTAQVPTSPSPAPEHVADAPFPPSSPPLVGVPTSSPPSSFPSPPAPILDLAPSSSPASSSHLPPESPIPSPSPSKLITHSGMDVNSTNAPEKSSGGMSGGKKFGIAFTVIVVAGLALFAGLVYKKRQDNIRRARYNYVAGANIL